MKSTIFALLAISVCGSAYAQEAVTPEVQALSSKIMLEVSQGLQCQTANIKLTKENEALKAHIKELEAPKDAKP